MGISLTAIVALVLGSSCSQRTESIRIAHAKFETSALVWIAEEQRFFAQNGLTVTSGEYDTGVGALDGMLSGDADIAVGTAEFPLVGRAFKQERMRIIGSIDKTEFIYLIARKDRGIETVSDLKGKRIGTTQGTIAEFYLGRFLHLHGMNAQDVALVDVKTPAEYGNAIADGDVDAVVSAQPNADLIKNRLGANAVVWPAQSGQPLYTLAIATEEWITSHPELVGRFLKSLAQAEGYLLRNPAEAKAIVQKRLNLDAAYMETVWSQNQFFLSLDQSLITAMEDEARWMITNRLTTRNQVPDFLDYIYIDGLMAIKPEAVNIIP
jgi:NitT/TauT family transport system substrate-binding protein